MDGCGAKQWLFHLSLALVWLGGAGCQRGPELVEVVGKVTYRGGPCPGPGSVVFAPVEVADGSGLRPATAEFTASGEFRAQSFRPGDGLKPGRYRVTLQCWKQVPQGFQNPGVSAVPPGYRPDELVVDSGRRRIELTYDIP